MESETCDQMRCEQTNLLWEDQHTYNIFVSLRLEVFAKAELRVRLAWLVAGKSHLSVVHLVLDRTKETRFVLGGVTTFVKDSKNLCHNE